MLILFAVDGLSNARDQAHIAQILTKLFDNDGVANEKLWTGIHSGHGLVSVTPGWTHAQGLPNALVHPKYFIKKDFM
jgi:hypothetical protein